MKKLIIVILISGLSFIYSIPVNALELGSGFDFKIKDPSGSASGTALSFTHSNNDWYADFSGSSLNNLAFDIVPYENIDTIPDRYLITFNVSYISNIGSSVSQGGYYRYDGLQSTNMQLLSESCVDRTNGTFYTGNVVSHIGQGIISCSYLFYSATNYDEFTSYPDSRIWYGESSTQNRIMITPGFIRAISWNGLTEDDREWLEEHMPTGSSTADIESAIESAREDEKQEYEDQQENVDSGAENAGEEAEEATSTLIETSRGIIETIRDTPATNCVIRINTGNFDTGNLNLCNVPQEIRTIISTVITIPLTLAALHIAYTTVMLYLNTVRKEQE